MEGMTSTLTSVDRRPLFVPFPLLENFISALEVPYLIANLRTFELEISGNHAKILGLNSVQTCTFCHAL